MSALAAGTSSAMWPGRTIYSALINSGAGPERTKTMLDKSPALKDGLCPVCGSRQVKSGQAVADKAGLGGSNRIPINAVFAVPLDNFVCADCGYVESYILDRAVLNRIEREWQKVLTTENRENAEEISQGHGVSCPGYKIHRTGAK